MENDVIKERYEIQRTLGARAGRQTFLARDRHTQEMVVVKLLTFGSILTWDTLKLFEREARTLQALDHPAIPRYHDYFEVETSSGKGFALVQSYIGAPSLEEHIKTGRTFSEPELKYIAKAVLEILLYLHTRFPPLIHRDIKPGNILLMPRAEDREEQLYLVDFGAVQAAARETGTITVVGTYGYMPPEQFGGRAVPASDLYGLGATLIYVVTGHHPADLPQQDLRICFEDHASLSPALTDWLRWLTEPNLERRLASASDALHALEQHVVRKNQSLVPPRPPDSKVMVNKTRDTLEIVMPPKGFSSDLLPMIGIAAVMTGFQIRSRGEPITALMAIFLISHIVFALFVHIRLEIDQEHLSLTYHLFGLKYNRHRPCLRHLITKIERTPTFYRENSEGDPVEVQPQINIWAGTKKFVVGGKGLLSEPELDWLAYELSDWLGLPINQKK
jgi:serine/threonine protein kinase